MSPDPHTLAKGLLGGSVTTNLLYVMVELGIPDLLDSRPRTGAQLAVLTDTLEAPLERVLRGLVALGVLQRAADGMYALTAVGACLRSGEGGSLQPLARWVGAPAIQQAWSSLLHTVRTGQPAFEHALGLDLPAWLEQDADGAERFSELRTDTTERVVSSIVERYAELAAFGPVVDVGGGHVVDVGGGSGALVRGVLRAFPQLCGTIIDLGHVRSQAERAIAADGLANRCAFIEGDAFHALPGGADAYLLGLVLHLWDDARCLQLLGACKRALEPTSRLLVIEQLLPVDGPVSVEVVMSDLVGLAMGSGRERSLAEYVALCDGAGLQLRRVVPTAAGVHLLEVTL